MAQVPKHRPSITLFVHKAVVFACEVTQLRSWTDDKPARWPGVSVLGCLSGISLHDSTTEKSTEATGRGLLWRSISLGSLVLAALRCQDEHARLVL